MQKAIRGIALCFLVLGLAPASHADRFGPWVYLGQAHVDGREDHDKISVNEGGSFRAIQIGVKGGAIEFYRVLVHFENGADHDVQVRSRIRSGEKTRVIDLPGDRRRIHSVEFWYGKGSWGSSRPWINLWGRR